MNWPTAVVILETPRMVLRRLEPRDLDALFVLYRDPEIRRYFPDGTRTFEETKQELEWFQHGHPEFPQLGLWATVERASGTFFGRCGLLPWEIQGKPEVELAFLIDKSRWGEGLATEAASNIIEYARSQLGLSRLICLLLRATWPPCGSLKRLACHSSGNMKTNWVCVTSTLAPLAKALTLNLSLDRPGRHTTRLVCVGADHRLA
jgi:RimJ/RimL family protein N-acetyltransferase